MNNKIKKATEYDAYFLIEDGSDSPFKVAKSGISQELCDRIRRMYCGGSVKMAAGGAVDEVSDDDLDAIEEDDDVMGGGDFEGLDQNEDDFAQEPALENIESEEDGSDLEDEDLLPADDVVLPSESAAPLPSGDVSRSAAAALNNAESKAPAPPPVDSAAPVAVAAPTPTPAPATDAAKQLAEAPAAKAPEATPAVDTRPKTREIDNPDAANPASESDLKKFWKTADGKRIQTDLLNINSRLPKDAPSKIPQGFKLNGTPGAKSIQFAENLGYVITKEGKVVPAKVTETIPEPAPVAAPAAASTPIAAPAPAPAATPATVVTSTPAAAAAPSVAPPAVPVPPPAVAPPVAVTPSVPFPSTPTGTKLSESYTRAQGAITAAQKQITELEVAGKKTLDQEVDDFIKTTLKGEIPPGYDEATFRSQLKAHMAAGFSAAGITRNAAREALESNIAELEYTQKLALAAAEAETAKIEARQRLDSLVTGANSPQSVKPAAVEVLGGEWWQKLIGAAAIAVGTFAGAQTGNPTAILDSVYANYRERLRLANEAARGEISERYKALRYAGMDAAQAERAVNAEARGVMSALAKSLSNSNKIGKYTRDALMRSAKDYYSQAAKEYDNVIDDQRNAEFKEFTARAQVERLRLAENKAQQQGLMSSVNASINLQRLNDSRAKKQLSPITMQDIAGKDGAETIKNLLSQDVQDININKLADSVETMFPTPAAPAARVEVTAPAAAAATETKTKPKAEVDATAAKAKKDAAKANLSAVGVGKIAPAAAPTSAAASPSVPAASPDANTVVAKSPTEPFFIDFKDNKPVKNVTGVAPYLVRPTQYKNNPLAAFYAGYAITPLEYAKLKSMKGKTTSTFSGIAVPMQDLNGKITTAYRQPGSVKGKFTSFQEAAERYREGIAALNGLKDYVPRLEKNKDGKIIVRPAKYQREAIKEHLVPGYRGVPTQYEAQLLAIIKSADQLGALDRGVLEYIDRLISLPQKVFSDERNDIRTYQVARDSITKKLEASVRNALSVPANEYQVPIGGIL